MRKLIGGGLMALGVVALVILLVMRTGAKPQCARDTAFQLKETVFDCAAVKRLKTKN